jgi:hypothetical protein
VKERNIWNKAEVINWKNLYAALLQINQRISNSDSEKVKVRPRALPWYHSSNKEDRPASGRIQGF